MRTLLTPQPTSSKQGVLRLSAPDSWSKMTDEQVKYVLTMMTQRSNLEVKILMLLRFCGIGVICKESEGVYRCYQKQGKEKVLLFLETWQFRELLHTFDFIDRYEDYTVRLGSVAGLKPVDELLHGVSFMDYLVLDKLYQGFLRNQSKTMLLEEMGRIMFTDKNGNMDRNAHFEEWQRLHVFLWYSRVKMKFSEQFPYFFKPAAAGGKVTERAVVNQINIQIRALTGGDITKENAVVQEDCWRALTELDAKAEEVLNMKKNSKKK